MRGPAGPQSLDSASPRPVPSIALALSIVVASDPSTVSPESPASRVSALATGSGPSVSAELGSALEAMAREVDGQERALDAEWAALERSALGCGSDQIRATDTRKRPESNVKH